MTSTSPSQSQPIHRKRRLIWRIFSVVFIIVFVGIALFLLVPLPETKPISIVLDIGGVTYPVTTSAKDVAELLEEQEIVVEADDMVSPQDYAMRLEDGMTVQITRARTVSLTYNGRTSILRTVFDNPQDIIRSVGIEVTDADEIMVDGTSADIVDLLVWPNPASEIVVRSAVTVTIVDGESAISHITSSSTVGEVLFEVGIDLFLTDTVTPDVSELVTPDMEIVVNRSKEVTIIVDGEVRELRTGGQTVFDALVDADIALIGLDYTIPSESTEVISGMSVRVIRVREELFEETETIPFETVYRANAEMELDTRRVFQAGQEGEFKRTFRVRYENDIEISRSLETEVQVSETQDQIIDYGTNIVIRTLDTPEGPVQYWRKLSVYTTSYHPAALGGDNITSVGETLRKGVIGVNPDIIPYYSQMYVVGYGVGFAADTGAPRNNPYWIDLGYEDHDWEHWAGWEDVYLLTPVPENIDYFLPVTRLGGPVP